MARLPSALQNKEDAVTRAIALRKENLARLNRGETPQALLAPPPLGAEPVAFQPQPLPDPMNRPQAVQPEPEPSLQAAPEPESQPQEAPAAPVTPQLDLEELRKAQARAETSEGMLRKANEERQRDREAARKAVETAQAREAALQAQIDDMERKERASKPLPMEELLRYYSQEEIDELGELQCRRIVRIAEERATDRATTISRSLVQAETREIRALVTQQQAMLERAQEDAFWRSINTGVPNWQEINAKTEFRAWLSEVEPISRKNRQSAIDEAKAEHDAPRIIAIFNAYMQSLPKPLPAAAPSRRVLPNGRPNAELPTELPTPATVTRAQIQDHNSKVARDRRYRNSPEATAMAAKIDQAARVGAIR